MLCELKEKEDQEAEYLKEVEKPQVDKETALAADTSSMASAVNSSWSEPERQRQAMEIQ